jgi:hypothetical protein
MINFYKKNMSLELRKKLDEILSLNSLSFYSYIYQNNKKSISHFLFVMIICIIRISPLKVYQIKLGWIV